MGGSFSAEPRHNNVQVGRLCPADLLRVDGRFRDSHGLASKPPMTFFVRPFATEKSLAEWTLSIRHLRRLVFRSITTGK